MRYLVLLLTLALAGQAASFADRFKEIRQAATPAELYTFLYALPKGGDLHNHSGGSERPEWIFAILTDPARNGGDTFYTRARFAAAPDAIAPAKRFHNLRQYGYDLLSAEARKEYVRLDALTPEERAAWCNSQRLDAPGEGREEFFAVVWPRRGQIGSNLPVITESLVESIKAFGAERLSYLETQFGVDRVTDNTGRPIPVEEAVAFVKKRLAQPDVASSGVTVRFQEAVLRFLPGTESAIAETYAFIDAHRDLWVGLNMVGIEENGFGYPARFLNTFRELRSTYPTLALSIHAGEMDGNDSHIRDTLLLGASRIGHGVNLLKDPDTLLLLQQSRRVLIEINLISNRLLEYTPDLRKHPFPEYLRTGVPVCLNTDDRGMWDSNMTDEYYTAVTTFNLSWEEIVQLGRNSLAHSFAQPEVKAKLLADYERAVSDFEAKFLPVDSLKHLAGVKPVTYTYGRRNWAFPFAQ
jgi:adenosine deaminase CECR1